MHRQELQRKSFRSRVREAGRASDGHRHRHQPRPDEDKENESPNLNFSATGGDNENPNQLTVTGQTSTAEVALKDDPTYGKYFSMLQQPGIRRHWVETLMESKGLDKNILNLNPNRSMNQSTPPAAEKGSRSAQESNENETASTPAEGGAKGIFVESNPSPKQDHLRCENQKSGAVEEASPLQEQPKRPKKALQSLKAMFNKLVSPTEVGAKDVSVQSKQATVNAKQQESTSFELLTSNVQSDSVALGGQTACSKEKALMARLNKRASHPAELEANDLAVTSEQNEGLSVKHTNITEDDEAVVLEGQPEEGAKDVGSVEAKQAISNDKQQDSEGMMHPKSNIVDDGGPPLKDDPKYMKYFKMLKMGLTKGAVQNAMQRDQLDPTIMDLDPEKSVASQLDKEEEIVDKGPALKDDPKYVKYIKMLKMGLPKGAVQNALQRDGYDPTILDLDPEKSVAYQMAMASRKSQTDVTREKSQIPKVRRTKIFWDAIQESNIDENSMWSMMKGSYDFDSLKVDQDEFTSLFTDTSNRTDKKKSDNNKPKESKQKKSVQVIDAKRGMVGCIILAKTKIEISALAGMVTAMDCGKLDDTELSALREFLPTKEERFEIDRYIKEASKSGISEEAAIKDFCACEKYMLAMMEVGLADEKFDAMLFKYQFDNKVKETMQSVATLISASEEVQKSVRLRKLLAMILVLGNQINTGGSGNMAHGFTLNALLKLDQAKAFDKKTSVLQYLVKLVKANDPDLLNVHTEMPSIVAAEKVNVEGLVSEMKVLSKQLSSVKKTAEAEGRRMRDGKSPSKMQFDAGVHMHNQSTAVELTAMEKFVNYAEKQASGMKAQIDEVQENFKMVLSYFGEDPAMTSAEFFGTLNKFVAAFDSALEVVKRIETTKLAAEKRVAAKKARAAAKKTSDADKSSKSTPFRSETQNQGEESENVNPRAALMPMSSKGAPPTPASEPKSKSLTTEQEEETKQADPRAALMSMLNKRAPPKKC